MRALSVLARPLVAAALCLFAMLLSGTVAMAQEDDGESLSGTIRDPGGDPLRGVTVTVAQNGGEIGSDTTGPEGEWEVELPGPGTYEVTLDLETLPGEAVPRERGGERLTGVSISPGQSRAVIFPLVSPDEQRAPGEQDTGGPLPPPKPPPGPPFIDRFLQALFSGIEYGAVIAISALGLSLVFGTTRLINFAHGELVTIGAVVAFFFNAAAAGPGVHLIIAALLAIVAGALVGGGLEFGLWRPLRNRGTGRINLFIISIGLSLLLRHLILVFYGTRPGSYAQYNIQPTIDIGPIAATPRDLGIIGLALLTLLGVAVLLQRTKIGTAIRAVADNRDLAESSGIDVKRVVLVVWLLAGALAGWGGVLFGLDTVISWNMGFKLLLLMFAGIILGGLGSAYGAMVGSLVVGIVAQLSTLWFSVELQNAWALLVLIVVLLVRPQGILGRRERVG